MDITTDMIDYVAGLARLSVKSEEKDSLCKDMNSIIEFANQLNELDTTGVEPTAHILPIKNVLREDEVKPSLDREKILQNAPHKVDGCFSVPQVVE